MMPAGTRNDQRGARVYTEGDGRAAKHRERYRASARDNDVHNVSSIHYISHIICIVYREYSVAECHQCYKK